MSTFLDYTGLRHFKEKLDSLFATKTSLAAVNNRIDNIIDITQSESESALEVADIRIGYDSATYNSAGDAIRAADEDFNTRLSALEAMDIEIDPDDLGLEQDAETSYVYPTYRGVRSSNGIYIAAGGGGGGGSDGNNAVITVTNTTGWLSRTITTGAACVLSLTWSSLEDGASTGSGTLQVTVGGLTQVNRTVAQGSLTVDVGSYLSTGSNKVKVKVTDVYDNSKTLTFTITVVALTIESYFSTSGTFVAGSPVVFAYTPYGALEKTVHFIVDGNQVGTSTVTASGVQQSYSIPASYMTHGAHTLLVYFTGIVDGDSVTSNELYYSLIAVDDSSGVPIISSSFRETTVTQYATLSIPYMVYTPVNLTSEIELYAKTANDTDYELVSSLTVDRTEHVWGYRADTIGSLSLMITTGSVAYTIAMTVSSAGVDIGAVTDDLALYLTSYGRSNNEADPSVWEDDDNNVSCTLTGFNYTSDGWMQDSDGITVLRVAGDARVTIPYQPFASDFRSTGKTIELEFATRNVRNYDTVVMSCMSGGRGFQLTAQRAFLHSEQSEISTQYKEDEHVRIAFVTEKRNENRLLMIYINGIMSGVVQYPTDDNFAQTTPVGISIGSNYATTDIYNIRIYDNNLTRHQVLGNWVADTQNVTTMLERYNHNDIFDEYWSVAIDNLPNDLPYLVISCAELPQYKGDKKTVSGYYVDPTDSTKSFSFIGAQADVQGTSSQYYPRKNYKIKFKSGFTMTTSGDTESTFAMNASAIPTNTFTFKADVASSEGANNVELVRLYNAICPYHTPPQEDNENVRQGIDGFPIVIFWNNTTNNSTTFVGKYNFNNDKGTPEVFGFDDGDESWEILNNTGNRVLWKSADYTGSDWLNDFEARYPDTDPAYTDSANLAALASWLVTTDQSTATGNALPSSYTDVDGVTHTVDNAAYRLAKFKTEAWDYLEKDSTIFYYLFTELFLMVDSRAKNAFPSLLGGDKWCWLPYDMDTAIGINNEGALVFDYSLEDIDQISDSDVYNGQQSVLWINLRQAFFSDIQTMYQSLRSTGVLSYNVIESMFEAHQSKWPEAIFNEDSWFKYIDPLVNDGVGTYLDMAQGSKAEQRKWWLYNRFRYIDSKYNAGDALTDVITLRGYAKDDITVTPYADIYPAVKYGSYLVTFRGQRNVPATLMCPLDNVNDTEIYIYSASQLSSIGDLSGLKVGLADLSNAVKLQNLKIGDSGSSYSNANLYSLVLGNNVLLQTIDVRNCVGLGDTTISGHTQTAVDVSGCVNLEHVYFDGTKIRSLTLPNGGILKTLHLPSTIANLTVMNQSGITDFDVVDTNGDTDYSNITTLRIENCGDAIPVTDILQSISANSRVRIVGFAASMETMSDVNRLMEIVSFMKGLDENGDNLENAVFSGTIAVTGTVTETWLDDMRRNWPNITVVYTNYVEDYLSYFNMIIPMYASPYYQHTVTSLTSDAFHYRSAMTSADLPSAEILGDYAFSQCSALTTVNMPVVTTVGNYAFQNCTSLTTLDFPSTGQITIGENAFNGARKLEHLIIRSASVATLSNTNAFTGTKLANLEGAIYVPSDLVDDYKSATNWSAYAEFIYPISAYPITDFSTITDSWSEIIANPNYATDYAIGDTKMVDINGTKVYMRIAAFDADVLSSDGESTASITWVSTPILRYSHNMNSKANADGGWLSSGMRSYLSTSILPNMPEVLQNNIKTVNKTYYNNDLTTLVSEDKLWIPSYREACFGTSREDSGVQYSGLFSNNASRIYYNTNNSAIQWWTRTCHSSGQFYWGTETGSSNSGLSSIQVYGVVLGFCT